VPKRDTKCDGHGRGWGYEVNFDHLQIFASGPTPDGKGWRVTARNTFLTQTITGFVLCVSYDGS
jgi:hypothetical protein